MNACLILPAEDAKDPRIPMRIESAMQVGRGALAADNRDRRETIHRSNHFLHGVYLRHRKDSSPSPTIRKR